MSSSREPWAPIFSQIGIMRNQLMQMSESEFQEKCQFCRECGFECPDGELARAIEESLYEQKKPTIIKPVVHGSQNSSRSRPTSSRQEKTSHHHKDPSPRGTTSTSSSTAKQSAHVRPSQNKPLGSIPPKQESEENHRQHRHHSSSKDREENEAKPSSRHSSRTKEAQPHVSSSSSSHSRTKETKENSSSRSKPAKETQETTTSSRSHSKSSSKESSTSSSKTKTSKENAPSSSSSKHSEEIQVKPPSTTISQKNPREQSQTKPKKPTENAKPKIAAEPEDGVCIAFAFPDGKRIRRKFSPSTKGSEIHQFIASQENMISSKGVPIKFSLQQTLGPQLKLNASLESQGVTKNTMFSVVYDDDQEL